MKLDVFHGVYQPREDSIFFVDSLKSLDINPVSIEIGSGSGIISLHLLLSKGEYTSHLAVDLNYDAALNTKHNAKINLLHFDVIAGDGIRSFRKGIPEYTILFNPPYLPTDPDIDKHLEFNERLALVGGIKGDEALIKHLKYLAHDQSGYYIISSLATNPVAFQQKLENFVIQVISSLKLSFETLWLIHIKRREKK